MLNVVETSTKNISPFTVSVCRQERSQEFVTGGIKEREVPSGVQGQRGPGAEPRMAGGSLGGEAPEKC